MDVRHELENLATDQQKALQIHDYFKTLGQDEQFQKNVTDSLTQEEPED